MRRFALFPVAVGVLIISSFAQSELPRRAYFGVGLEKHPDGIRVFSITEGSAAAAAGMAIGDFIESVDDHATSSPEATVAAIARHKGGESVKIDVRRSDTRRTINVILKTYPVEQMANATLQYGSVRPYPDVRLRTIISTPDGQSGTRYPAVLLLQGGSCGSIDTPFSPNVGQPALIHTLGSRQFVTMRVEKSGVGDSEGSPCESIGFEQELAGYRAALQALRSHPSVDPQRIYLLGISLGGVFAPLLGSETSVAGIVVWGTPGGPTPPFPGRSERFFQEFARVNISAAWANVVTRVLVLHAEYDVDPVINRDVHESIARIVMNSGKGSAEFRELAGLDHCWTRHPSLEASKDRCGQGQETSALADAILGFLQR
jgi:dienelactone hydrolase